MVKSYKTKKARCDQRALIIIL